MAHPRSHRDPFADDSADPDLLESLRPLPPGSLADWVESYRHRLTDSPKRVVFVVLGAVLVAGVGWWLLRPPVPPIESTLPLASAASAASAGSAPAGGTDSVGSAAVGAGTSTTLAEMVVQASGAVDHPGVYRLAAGARVDDLVRAAGGLATDADVDRVNLAALVADGERVWVPHRGEAEPPPVVAGAGGGGAASGPASSGGGASPSAAPTIVDLNTATAEQLETLPGVGPATAMAILSYRDEHGPFASVDDLLEVRGIGDAKLEQIRALATV